MDEDLETRLLEKLNQIELNRLADYQVVLMPDFFIDHFLTMENFERDFARIKDIYVQGGGNVPGIQQRVHQGGNAANTALALARLGVKTCLICRTDEFGLHLLQYFLGNYGVDLSRVKTDGKVAITTAMEFGKQHVNVLVGDTGSVSDFTFECLDENDLHIISNSDIVGVVNWSLNKEGTGLAKDTFRFAKKHNIKTFFDTGDPAHRKNEIPELRRNVLSNEGLDILGLNENELLHYSDLTKAKNDKHIVNAAFSLKEKIHARVDLHTSNFACTINKNYTIIPTLRLTKIYRVTGAGDTWNAGNIFAELFHFDDDERLLFANLVAGCYISSSDPVHPNLERIRCFIEENNNFNSISSIKIV